jgi:hypothetical protein
MEAATIHPHTIVAGFVNKYKDHIRPYLARGDLDGIRFLIGDVCLRWADFEQMHQSSKKGVYARYRMAIQYIWGLFDEKDVSASTLQTVIPLVDRRVEELEFILSEDEHYKAARRTSE